MVRQLPHRDASGRQEGQGPQSPGPSPHRQDPSSVAYTVMAGMMLGGGIGVGLDELLGTLPLFLAVGMVAGLAFAVYVAYLRMR
jgi:F0F1-type ATP synthase assembly protein I